MSKLYSVAGGHAAIMALSRAMRDRTCNLPALSSVVPNSMAPIVRNAPDGVRELTMGRWGMPSSQKARFEAIAKQAEKLEVKGKLVKFNLLLRTEPDRGATNIRYTASHHWRRWLGIEHRCLVPFNSFCKFKKAAGGNIWFALDETRPLAFFAGIWTTWTSVRQKKEGKTTNDLFGILNTRANDTVGAISPKAMPVILTTLDEIEVWMTAPADEALKLKRPLADGALKIVARGEQKDEGPLRR